MHLQIVHSLGALVGEEGIEPSIRKEHDFESCAYTSSATRPYCNKCNNRENYTTAISKFAQAAVY